MEKDSALERRLAKVQVDEPSQEEAVQILQGLRPRYEEHHGLRISDEAIEAAVTMSVRYIHSRQLPDKAIDLIDESAAKVRLDASNKPSQSSAAWFGLSMQKKKKPFIIKRLNKQLNCV